MDAGTQSLLRIWRNDLEKASPLAQWEYVDVTFNTTADADTDIRYHRLTPTNPDDIRYLVVTFYGPHTNVPVIYRDTGANRRAWGDGWIVLRSNESGLQVRLLLFLER